MNEFSISFATKATEDPHQFYELVPFLRKHLGDGCVIDLLDVELYERVLHKAPLEEWPPHAVESPQWISAMSYGNIRDIMFSAQDVVRRDIPGNWIPSSINCKLRDTRDVMIMNKDDRWTETPESARLYEYLELSFWGYGGPTIINTPDFPLQVVQRFLEIPPVKAIWDDIRTLWDRPMIIAAVA